MMSLMEDDERLFKKFDYALINPRATDRARWDHFPWDPLPMTSIESGRGPVALSLDRINSFDAEDLFRSDNAHAEAGELRVVQLLMQTRLWPHQLDHHLYLAAHFTPPGTGTRPLLNICAPAAMQQFDWMLTKPQWGHIMKSSTRWAYPIGSSWVQVDPPPADVGTVMRVQPTLLQDRMLKALPVICDVLEQVKAPELQRGELGQYVWRSLDKAALLGLTDDVDLTVFARNEYMHGPYIHDGASFRQLAKSWAGDRRSYIRWAALQDNETWHSLRGAGVDEHARAAGVFP